MLLIGAKLKRNGWPTEKVPGWSRNRFQPVKRAVELCECVHKTGIVESFLVDGDEQKWRVFSTIFIQQKVSEKITKIMKMEIITSELL